MAARPVFHPSQHPDRLVEEVDVEFSWHRGMALSQLQKNVHELHDAAARSGINPLLEVSSKSDEPIGKRLSAFSLKIEVCGQSAFLESAYQSSKVFEGGGPYLDLLYAEPRYAKQDVRIRQSGRIVAFELCGERFPNDPPTAFYDWIYLQALFPHREFLRRLSVYSGFTDISFNPERSLNCQARSCALLVSLERRNLFDQAMSSFASFAEIIRNFSPKRSRQSSIYQATFDDL